MEELKLFGKQYWKAICKIGVWEDYFLSQKMMGWDGI